MSPDPFPSSPLPSGYSTLLGMQTSKTAPLTRVDGACKPCVALCVMPGGLSVQWHGWRSNVLRAASKQLWQGLLVLT